MGQVLWDIFFLQMCYLKWDEGSIILDTKYKISWWANKISMPWNTITKLGNIFLTS
jgi:hypothetical protein